ncbi:hypothetical protein HU200_037593 [Digitaria exilis]|uniref:Bifunctional inhibitor/plant lipid transfer protein/seed storage helical domain-containing protein n=1 Tax=Digitaria exilis TaxID=1010633 RepID=A0A835BLS4_9POAL|nr:hypothetical protein HU200_037593 [Digitaria exilis]CAB3453462.1 unnamed protein product [Digitaria exilis]
MKAMLVALALLAIAVSATATHTCGQQAPPMHQCPCHQQPQQQYPQPPPVLSQCSELLRQQCSPVATPYCSPQCQMLRQQCCQQLRQVEPQHQYHAVYTMVMQMVLQQQPYGGIQGPQGQMGMVAAQIAQQLTATCGLNQQPPCSACGTAFGGVPY